MESTELLSNLAKITQQVNVEVGVCNMFYLPKIFSNFQAQENIQYTSYLKSSTLIKKVSSLEG